MKENKERYARVGHPKIESIVNGVCKFNTRSDALERLNIISVMFTMRRQEPGEEERIEYELLWIRDFEVTEEERDKGYMGNYARIQYEEHEGKHYLFIKKEIVELKYHPRRKRPKNPMPNWGHPKLRFFDQGAKRIYKSTIEEAKEHMQSLAEEYPKCSVMTDEMKLFIQIFSRKEDPKKPVQKWIIRAARDESERPYLFIERNFYESHAPVFNNVEKPDLEEQKEEYFLFARFLFRENIPSEQQVKIAGSFHSSCRDYDRRRLLKLESNSPSDHNIFYHFTTLEGFEGILKSQSLWLTDLQCMNDLLEIRHGWSRIQNILTHYFDNDNELAPIAEKILNRLDGPNAIKKQDIYGFSLCEIENLSNQWQVYGNDGRGVALGFDITKLLQSSCIFFSKVYYHDKQKQERIYHFLKAISNTFDLSEEWEMYSAKVCNMLSAYLKHPGFYSEREWRITCLEQSQDVKYRDTANIKSVPYYQIKFSDIIEGDLSDILKKVVVGPTADDTIKRSVQALMTRYGLNKDNKEKCYDESKLPLAFS